MPVLDLPVARLTTTVDLLMIEVPCNDWAASVHGRGHDWRQKLAWMLVLALSEVLAGWNGTAVLKIHQLLIVLHLLLTSVEVLEIPCVLEVGAWHVATTALDVVV